MPDWQLPEKLGSMFKHLSVVSLRGNELTVLPDSMRAMRHLSELSLMQCRCARAWGGACPVCVCVCVCVRVCVCSRAAVGAARRAPRFEIVPPCITSLPLLSALDMSNNALRTLDGLDGATALTRLMLENNKLTVCVRARARCR